MKKAKLNIQMTGKFTGFNVAFVEVEAGVNDADTVYKASLKWCNEYINRDGMVRQPHTDLSDAKRQAKVSILGKVVS